MRERGGERTPVFPRLRVGFPIKRNFKTRGRGIRVEKRHVFRASLTRRVSKRTKSTRPYLRDQLAEYALRAVLADAKQTGRAVLSVRAKKPLWSVVFRRDRHAQHDGTV